MNRGTSREEEKSGRKIRNVYRESYAMLCHELKTKANPTKKTTTIRFNSCLNYHWNMH